MKGMHGTRLYGCFAALALVLSLQLVTARPGLAGTPGNGVGRQMVTVPITLGEKTIHAVVADTEPRRIKGLLGWDRIDDSTGMLLDFERESEYAIHMQGMKFPIDAVWIDRTGTIRVIYKRIQPNAGVVFPSIFPARYCLELKAGFCDRYGVKKGQRVRFGPREKRPKP